MSQSTIIAIIVVVLIALLLFLYLLRGRKQHVALSEPARAPAPLARATTPEPLAPPAPAFPIPPERHGIGSEVTAAVEDVIDQFIGIDAHPSGQDQRARSGDTLTQLKGLGPRAATKLGELGVTRFDQIAEWDAGDVAAIDAQMGAFKGRILRDRWVDQAKLLASGDEAAFEAEFGKLGG